MTEDTPGSSQTKSPLSIRWWWGLIVFILVMSLQVIFSFVMALVAVFFMGEGERGGDGLLELLFSPLFLGIQVIATSGMLVAVSLLFPLLLRNSVTQVLGARPTSLPVVVLSVVGVMTGGFLVDQTLFLLHDAWPVLFALRNLEFFGRAFSSASVPAFVLLTVIVSIGPGIGEEFLFRGVILRSGCNGLPVWGAVTLSAVLFGIMHMDPLQGFGAGMIGFYFGFLAIRTGSIWPAVWAHGANNFLASIFSRFSDGPATEIWTKGHPWWLLVIMVLLTALSVVGLLKLTSSIASNERLS